VNPFDTQALAERIGRLLADGELSRRMGAAGRARLLERFGIERAAAEYLEEYQAAVAAAGARPAVAPNATS
jgi:glycosyltransferase involved in cell wall biosynthesis